MRLLDVHRLELKQFMDDKKRPPYAILSHTWGDGEVSFQDLPTSAARSMSGFSKIKKCCELAIQDGFEYVWVDTCCIDKTSSAELSEAINSMYQWYKSSTVCYAFLSDVKTGDNSSDPNSSFSKSRWFTRGWTLQELLAPYTVVFYDGNWTEIGTKSTLQMDISRITGIAVEGLSTKVTVDFSIAQRMSWAAKRKTTRVEDIAYCLMGIFRVNMPTLYGEGEQAFIRLQHEILKSSDDHTLFAWTYTTPTNSLFTKWVDPEKECPEFWDDSDQEFSMLAKSPLYFQYAHEIQRLETTGPTYPFSMTNKGLHIWLPLALVQDGNQDQEIYRAILNCKTLDDPRPLVIYLRREPSGEYCRTYTDVLGVMDTQYSPSPVELYIADVEDGIPFADTPTFTLVENPSITQSGTFVGHKYDWEETPNLRQVIHLRPVNQSSPQFLYIVAENKVHPKVRAMVILALERDEDWTTPYTICCAVYSGQSKIEKAKLCRNFYDFDRVTRNVDRITETLPGGHFISVAFRRYPVTGRGIHYRIIVSFMPPNSKHKLSGLSVNLPQAPPPIRLTVHIGTEHDISPTGLPKGSWTANEYDPRFFWTPPDQQEVALLRLNHPRIQLPVLIFRFVDSDIAVLIFSASDTSRYGPSSSESDATILLNARGNLTHGHSGQRWYRSKDFPQEVRTSEGTMVIKLRGKMFLREPGHQMQVMLL
jgi:hypothetical protein